MKEMIKYLIIAVVVGGAVPIILSHLTKKTPKHRKKNDNSDH